MYSQVSDNESGLEAWPVPINQKILTHQNARDMGWEHGVFHSKMNVQSGTSGWNEGTL